MDEAIEAYSKAIALEENHIFYSNRSAAYLTKGDAEKALADAITCLELNPDFVKGYSRKGAALQGLKQYAAAVQALEDGLAKFPENSPSVGMPWPLLARTKSRLVSLLPPSALLCRSRERQDPRKP